MHVYTTEAFAVSTHRLPKIAGLVALLALLTSCTPPRLPDQPTAVPDSGPVVVVDSRGREVEVPADVQRIVSLAPSNTEILFALGLGDKIVGVTNFCDYPEGAKSVAKVGDAMEMNVEKIVSLSPDLVLAIDGMQEVQSSLEEVGLAVVVLQPADLEAIYETIELVGQAAGGEEAAQTLVDSMRAKIEAVTAKVQDVSERPKVFYELDGTDAAKPWTAGAGSWHDRFINMVGGVNIAGSVDMAWLQFSAEEIVAQDPDIIVLGDANYGVTPEAVAQRAGWDVIAAVRSGAVRPIDDNLISRPGPRVADGVEALAKIIHPDLFE